MFVYFKPEKLRVKPVTFVMMNDIVIKIESSCGYLRYVITDDNENIKRQLFL